MDIISAPVFIVNGDTAQILIHNEVTETMAEEIVSGLVSIESIPEITKVEVSICSGGGSVLGGYSIFSALQRSNKDITIYNHGFCASIAGIIFLAVPKAKRIATNYSLFMIHNPSGADSKTLGVIKQSLIEILSNTFDKSLLDEWMNEETWLNADQQLEMGVVSQVIYTGDTLDLDPKQSVTNLMAVCNSILKSNSNLKMNEKLKNDGSHKHGFSAPSLKNEGAAPVTPAEETPVDTAIEAITETADSLEQASTADEQTSILEDLKKQIEALQAQLGEVTQRAEQAEAKIKASKDLEEEKMKLEVLNQAGITQHDKWLKLDLETIKNLTSTVKVTKVAPVVTISNTMSQAEFNKMSKEDRLKFSETNNKEYINFLKKSK